jgi:hypothetical protein
LERLARDKCSRLLRKCVNYGCKKFIGLAPEVHQSLGSSQNIIIKEQVNFNLKHFVSFSILKEGKVKYAELY